MQDLAQDQRNRVLERWDAVCMNKTNCGVAGGFYFLVGGSRRSDMKLVGEKCKVQ